MLRGPCNSPGSTSSNQSLFFMQRCRMFGFHMCFHRVSCFSQCTARKPRMKIGASMIAWDLCSTQGYLHVFKVASLYYMFSSMSGAHIHIIHIDSHHAEWIDKCICKQSRATSPTISQETGGFCHQILLWTCTSAECKTNRKKLTKGYHFNGFLERRPVMSYLNMPLQIVNSPTQHMYDRKIRDARTWNEMLWLYS